MQVASATLDIAERSAGLETSFWALANKLAAEYGTPFYVYFPHRAEAAFRALRSATAVWGPAHAAYSVKTNPLAALLHDAEQWGAHAEVVSKWEFDLARAAGFPPHRIVFNGPLKPDADLRDVLRTAPMTVNVDSLDELGAIESVLDASYGVVPVGLRICPPRANGVWSRFGLEVDTGEFREAVDRCAASPFMRLRCVHFHLGTQIEHVKRYIEVIESARRLWEDLRFDRDIHLDIGGGFPYDHGLSFDEQPFVPANFFATLADAWGPSLRPQLLIEPGRFIAAPSMAVVSRVLSCKPRSDEPTIVVLDSGTNHNVMAAFYEHLWSYRGTASEADYRLCGPLCMEDDILSGLRHAPAPALGELVATLNAGAYSLALARTFIQPRPPIFRFERDGSCEQLEHRETHDRLYGGGSAASGPTAARRS